MRLSSGDRLGHYTVLSPLGQGGMGEVYHAHDPRLGRDVAIKLLSPQLSEPGDRRQRFEREARVVARLNVGTGYYTWSQTFDQRPEDVFAIRDEIAAHVSRSATTWPKRTSRAR